RGATSEVADFTRGRFEPVIDDARTGAGGTGDPSAVKRVLLHSGKIHYDLLAELEKRENAGAFALVRLEQFYPLPIEQLLAVAGRYPDAELWWVQDEPENQGAWPFLSFELAPQLGGRALRVSSRPASASPATGSSKRSAAEQTALIARALEL
ncbi:MAG: multifunctional oxoglutarate decarboxylase/oxoglutarate dehydrogenase thiamine pyrophosphate-binding subunit/dihydrolipoyllysine-residue succinyltransferase subunit, partial [Protaetiibacter sp.]